MSRPSPCPIPIHCAGSQPEEKGSSPEASRLSSEVGAVIQALNRAERPLILAGNGIRLAKAEQEFTELRNRLQIPVGATWCAADLVPSEYPLNIGRPGSVAARGANFALQNCDFLLVLGARLDFAITGYAPDRLARDAHKVMVDIDPAELKKLEPHIQHPIRADAKAFLTEMLAQAKAIEAKPRDGVEVALHGMEVAISRGDAGASQAGRARQHLSSRRGDRQCGRRRTMR